MKNGMKNEINSMAGEPRKKIFEYTNIHYFIITYPNYKHSFQKKLSKEDQNIVSLIEHFTHKILGKIIMIF